MAKREVVKFLEGVWLPQSEGDYACVAWKDGELWRQRFIHRDDVDRAYQNRGRDLYFCPNLFVKPERTNEAAAPSMWLYADLDEVDPETIDDPVLKPDLWWETSPGRFQAMWELDEPLSKAAHSKLNQKLTYYLNADLNGWPMSKVLRMPGSVSTKWGKPWRVREGEAERPRSGAKAIWRIVRDVEVPAHSIKNGQKVVLPQTTRKRMRELQAEMPATARALLRRRYVQDRSKHIFLIAKLLTEANWEPTDISLALTTSPVAQEKYGNRLDDEVDRVVGKVASEPTQASKPKAKQKKEESAFPVEGMNRFLAREITPPGWLIGGIWSNEAHGMIAGEEKTYKSMFVQDLAVSVATGTPFLDHFPVPDDKVGPVIYVQEENPVSMVQDRFLKICISRQLNGRRGKLPKNLPVHVINNAGVDITDHDHLQELAHLIKKHKAKLLILDPFYLMAPGIDENSASEVIPVLKNLLRIKQQLNCGILIVHHYKKQDKQNPFSGGETGRISGTGTFGRWYESLLLIERDEEDNTVKLYAKHRMNAPEPPVRVEFDMGDMGDYRYEPRVVETKTEARNFYDELKAAVEEQPGISAAALAKAFGMRTERMTRQLRKSTHFRLEVQANRSPMVYIRT